ncbi:MAG: hypothetical protein FJW31_09670 [Acidobacteria bacterium]|nr:hypothetical protein [Acidobacteriota bacterium]
MTLQPDTQYFFFMGSSLGDTQVLWQSIANPYAGGHGFKSFAGTDDVARLQFDNVFVLQGNVAEVAEPGRPVSRRQALWR